MTCKQRITCTNVFIIVSLISENCINKISFMLMLMLMSSHRSVVTATVLYDSNSIVDISQIQKRLLSNDTTANISIRDNSEAEVGSIKICYACAMHSFIHIFHLQNVYKAENRLLFWLLIIFAFLIALAILILLLCCTCPWCPLYNTAR